MDGSEVHVKEGRLAALILDGPDNDQAEWAEAMAAELDPIRRVALDVVQGNPAFHFSMHRLTEEAFSRLKKMLARPGYGHFFAAYYAISLACVSPSVFSMVFESSDSVFDHAALVEQATSVLASNDLIYKTRIELVERWFDGISLADDWHIMAQQRQGPLQHSSRQDQPG